MPYCHLSENEREVIAQMRYAGRTLSEIAGKLRRHKATISRELRRNRSRCRQIGYSSILATLLARQRRGDAKRQLPRKIKSADLLRYVKSKLKLDWSPEQIAGRMRLERGDDLWQRISHPSIYKWIKQDKDQGGEYYKTLRQSHRQRRQKYGSKSKRFHVEGRVSIDDRPQVVARRSRIGDWEGDLMEGKNRTAYLMTLVDRRTGFLLTKKIVNKESWRVRKATIQLLRKVKPEYRKTITFDNGSEFSDFKRIEEAIGVKTYFAHPYSSWERGTNENTNGLVRQYAPKGTDLRRTSPRELAKAVQRLNNRPRKRLGYHKPYEVLRMMC